MQRYLKIGEDYIKVDTIDKVEFISDDIYKGSFPNDGVDYVSFNYANLVLDTGEKVELTIELYWPEVGETEEGWRRRYRAIINKSMFLITEAIGEIADIEGVQHEV